jgi:amino acid adenylation domain-containing protein
METPVHELIAEHALHRPDAVAVSGDRTELTFRELEADASRLAGRLGAHGVGRGDRVAVLLERSPDSVVAQLAVFKLGAAVVLLDPEHPAARIGFALDECAVTAVVTRQALLERFGTNRTVVLTDSPEWTDTVVVSPEVTGDEVSHIAFTSGSTGVPKAVLLRHRAFSNTVRVLVEQCGIEPGSRGTWLCGPGFGLVEMDFFPVLAAGGTVVIPDQLTASSPEALRDWLIDRRITHTLQLTAMAERLWALPWPPDCALRSMRVAGELLRDWPPAGLPFRVLNVYGSTEANVVATCDLTELAGGPTVPVGRPVPNVRAYVLDGSMAVVAPGIVGELYVSGAGLSQGYLNRAEATAATFLPNPITDDPHPVLYRTGDHARRWPDGTIEVVGRADDEVKIMGHRVYPGEVESVLAAQPGVRRCAVIAREDGDGGRRLVAYVEPEPANPPHTTALRAVLARALPAFMLPSAWIVTELPTTSGGKIDRRGLPEEDTCRSPESTM